MSKLKTLVAIPLAATLLTGCYEVENGPAFSGGDEIPGFAARLVTIANQSSDTGTREETDPDDLTYYTVRRALNGSYVLTEEDDDDDPTTITALRFDDQTRNYVVEMIGANPTEEDFLGVLHIEGRGETREFYLCLDMAWETSRQQAIAQNHNVTMTEQRFGNDRLAADDPQDLFRFMRALWRQSESTEWDCSILGIADERPEPPGKGG